MMKRKIVSIFALLLSLTILFCSCLKLDIESYYGKPSNSKETENLQEITEDIPQKETEEQTEAQETEFVPKEDFVINQSTMKFHYPTCHYVQMMIEENKLFVSSTYGKLTDDGYSPCSICQ